MEQMKLYGVLFKLTDFGQWADRRHHQCLVNMLVGLILSFRLNMSDWVAYCEDRGIFASSWERRFSRWLENERIDVIALYGPIVREILRGTDRRELFIALDTSMLHNRICHVRFSVVWQGRAIPLIWKSFEHASSSIGFEQYAELLKTLSTWIPAGVQPILLADRGFGCTSLMELCDELGWKFRIRLKSTLQAFIAYYRVHLKGPLPYRGEARFHHNIVLTRQRKGPWHLALGRPSGTREDWIIISNDPTTLETFDEYGQRFCIEENFLDDKSNGFCWAKSRITRPAAIDRQVLIMALATVYLSNQGAQVEHLGKRRLVDGHTHRGRSYLKIGYHWIIQALIKGEEILSQWTLPGGFIPSVAKASLNQYQKHQKRKKSFFRKGSDTYDWEFALV